MLIRPAEVGDAPAIARVHVKSWRTAYAGLIDADFLAALSYERREAGWRQALTAPAGDRAMFVAESDPGQVVGFAATGPEREGDPAYTGELYALYLLAEFQRLGIGTQLFRTAARDLHRRGMPTMLVWVLADNPARRFYEAQGGLYLREKEVAVGDQMLLEVAYGWLDTRALTGR